MACLLEKEIPCNITTWPHGSDSKAGICM